MNSSEKKSYVRSPAFFASRERRQVALGEALGRRVTLLRDLSGSGKSMDEARLIRDQYAWTVFHYPAGVGGDAFVEFLLSDESAFKTEEQLDDMFANLYRNLCRAEIDAADHAAGAIRQAMYGSPR